MRKLMKNKKLIIVLSTILFFFLFLISLHFYTGISENKNISKDSVILPEEDEFQNHSSLSTSELEHLVDSKMMELKNLFYQSKVYELTEIDPTKTQEDNEKFVVFDDIFLNTFSSLVVSDIYQSYSAQMTFLKEDSKHQFFVADRNIFDSVYLDSAIANVDVKSNHYRLILADDSHIQASVTLVLENESEIHIPFSLEKVESVWKVNQF